MSLRLLEQTNSAAVLTAGRNLEHRAHVEAGKLRDAIDAVQVADDVAGERLPLEPRFTRNRPERQDKTIGHGPDQEGLG